MAGGLQQRWRKLRYSVVALRAHDAPLQLINVNMLEGIGFRKLFLRR